MLSNNTFSAITPCFAFMQVDVLFCYSINFFLFILPICLWIIRNKALFALAIPLIVLIASLITRPNYITCTLLSLKRIGKAFGYQDSAGSFWLNTLIYTINIPSHMYTKMIVLCTVNMSIMYSLRTYWRNIILSCQPSNKMGVGRRKWSYSGKIITFIFFF